MQYLCKCLNLVDTNLAPHCQGWLLLVWIISFILELWPWKPRREEVLENAGNDSQHLWYSNDTLIQIQFYIISSRQQPGFNVCLRWRWQQYNGWRQWHKMHFFNNILWRWPYAFLLHSMIWSCLDFAWLWYTLRLTWIHHLAFFVVLNSIMLNVFQFIRDDRVGIRAVMNVWRLGLD